MIRALLTFSVDDKMLGKLTPESAITFTKMSIIISLSWPLSITATKLQIICFRILCILSYLNIVCLFVPLLILLEDCGSHPIACIKSYPFIAGCIHSFITMGISQFQHKRLQSVIAEMENYCKHAKDNEKTVLQQYVNRCATFYAVMIIGFYSGAFGVICSTPFTSDTFPTYAKYPFDVYYQPLKTIIYLQQSVVGIQFSSMLCISVLVALLLWFTTARFDILCTELRNVLTAYELIRCIQKHQQLLRFADEVIKIVRLLILTTIVANALSVIFSGALFVTRQPFIVVGQFFMLSILSLGEVFMCCWPANNLLSLSSDIAQATYESVWYYQNAYKKNLLFILLKCQKPVIITVACVVPILSLNFFGSFLSSSFSYVMTIRVMMKEYETNEA